MNSLEDNLENKLEGNLGAFEELSAQLQGQVLADEPLWRHNSYRIGGKADFYIHLDCLSDISRALELLERYEISWVILGKGTNLLVSDFGYRGAVLVLGLEFKQFSISDEGELVAGAAVLSSRLVQAAYSKGFGGLEVLAGVPGTLGGALAMNAGTKDEWIGSLVQSLVVYIPGKGLRRIQGYEIDWYYRCSNLPRNAIILEAVLQLKPCVKEELRAKMESLLNRRKRTQDLRYPSCGSVFVNPEGRSVGRLVEDLGLKGTSHGGAQISERHGNFIVNKGKASAQDVLALIALIKQKVGESYGIELSTEVKFLGF